MNKKGFMMAELVVVSSVVLITLVGLYTSYNKIYSMYKTRVRYYDVVTLYRLGYYRDILYKNNVLNDVINSSNSGIVEVYNSNNNSGSISSLPEAERPTNVQDKVYMINNAGGSINRDIFSSKSLHVTFLEYIDFLKDSVDFTKFNHMLIMERCTLGDDNSCSYAYLEILERGSSGNSGVLTCSLTVEGTTIKATYDGVSGGISYYGFNSDKTGGNQDTKEITSAGTYTFYVADNVGNENSCSVNVENRPKTASYERWQRECTCRHNTTHILTTVTCGSLDVNACSCPSITTKISCGGASFVGYYCTNGEQLSGSSCVGKCSEGYNAINDSYCYIIS